LAKLSFLGSPEVAAIVLGTLLDAGHEVPLVVTRPPSRAGRGLKETPTKVEVLARQAGSSVSYDPEDVSFSGTDLAVVVAYGKILPAHLVKEMVFLNLHFSLLPRWRGPAPVARAILAGDETTGVSFMRIDQGLDTGPVYATIETFIGPTEHADDLEKRLARSGARVLLDLLAKGAEGLPEPHPQVGEPTYAPKLQASELELTWEMPALELVRKVRAGRAWTRWRGGRLLVLEAREAEAPEPESQGRDAEPPAPKAEPRSPGASPGTVFPTKSGLLVTCGQGGIELLSVQPEGKRPMEALAWWRGTRLAPGDKPW